MRHTLIEKAQFLVFCKIKKLKVRTLIKLEQFKTS